MHKLNDSESRVLLALVQERDRAVQTVEEFVRFLGKDMAQPSIERRPDGLWLVDAAEASEEGT